MAVRTIGVNIVGEDDVKRLQKQVDNLKKAVTQTENLIGKLGGSKSPSFSIKVTLNKSTFEESYQKLKRLYQSDTKAIKFKTGLVTKGVNDDLKALKKRLATETVTVTLNTSQTKKNARATFSELKSTLQDVELKAKIGVNKTYFRNSIRSLKRILDEHELTIKVKASASGSDSQQLTKSLANMNNSVSNSASLGLKGFNFDSYANSSNKLSQQLSNILKKAVRISTLDPARYMAKGFTVALGSVVRLNTAIEQLSRNTIQGILYNAFYSVTNQISSMVRSVVEEIKEIGDSLVTYRLQMEQLGHSSSQINNDLGTLTDYGKKTVYDASDLITQAGNYTAYGRDDSIELVKAIAGLSAQTKNPNESLEHIGVQLNDVLARQKVTWQDVRIMKTWFNAQGSKAVQDILQHKAEEQGFSSVTEAMRENAFTVDDLVGAIKTVGLSDSFQKLVNTIATPTQAIDNLKENLSNLFIVPDYDGQGGVSDAPLQKTYDSITQFIKGISDVVGSSSNLKNGIRGISDDISGFIDGMTDLIGVLKKDYASSYVKSLAKLHSEYKIGSKQSGLLSKNIKNLVKDFTNFNNGVGRRLGNDLPKLTQSIFNVVDALIKVGQVGIRSGFFEGLSELIDFYANIGRLAIDSGAIKSYVKIFTMFYDLSNKILRNASVVSSSERAVKNIRKFSEALLTLAKKILLDSGAVKTALDIVGDIADSFKDLVNKVKKNVSTSVFKKAFSNIRDAVDVLVQGLADVYANLISSAIQALASGTGKHFMEAIANFFVNVSKAVEKALAVLGDGSVEKGLENILGVLTKLINALATVANIMAKHPKLTVGIVSAIYLIKKIAPLVAGLVTLVAQLKDLGIIGSIGKGVSSVGKVASKGVSAGEVVSDVAGASLLSKLGSGIKGTFSKFVGTYAKEIGTKTAPSELKWVMNSIDDAGVINMKQVASGTAKKGLFTTIAKHSKAFASSTKTVAKDITANLGAKVVGKVGSGLKSLIKPVTSLKGNLALLAADIGLDWVNNKVMNSDASRGTKQAVGIATQVGKVGTSAISGASIGTMIAPGVGTVIGGIAGATLGFLGSGSVNEQIDKAETEKINKQFKAYKEKVNALNQAVLDNVNQVLENIDELKIDYTSAMYSLRTNSGTVSDALQTTAEYFANVSGTNSQIKADLDRLGINMKLPLDNMRDAYVKVGDEIVKWTDLKAQTGIQNDQVLLGLLNKANEEMGIATTTFTDEAGNIITSIQTVTEQEKQRREQRVQEFIGKLGEVGNVISQYEELTYNGIKDRQQSLKEVMNTTYATKEDKRQALIEAISQGNQQINDALQSQSLAQIEEQAKTFTEYKLDTTVTEEEKAELTKKLIELKGQVTGKFKKLTLDDMQDVVKALDEAEKASESADNSSKQVFIQAMSELGLSRKKLQRLPAEDIAKANNLFAQAELAYQNGETEEGDVLLQQALNTLNMNNTKTFNKTKKNIDDYGAKLNEATTTLSQYDIPSGIMTSSLEEANSQLFGAVDGKVKDTKGKIDETKNSLGTVDFGLIDTSVVALGAQSLWDAVSGLVSDVGSAIDDMIHGTKGKKSNKKAKKKSSKNNFFGGLVKQFPEYHANGNLVGIDWKKRGTDTVPTMLTKGEYVLRKKAVDSLGLNFLDKLNTTGREALSNITKNTTVYNVYNNNNASINQNIDNKSQYLNGMQGLDRLMRYV